MDRESWTRTAWAVGAVAMVVLGTWVFSSGEPARMTGPASASAAVVQPADGVLPRDGVYEASGPELGVTLCVLNGGRQLKSITVSTPGSDDPPRRAYGVVLGGRTEIGGGRFERSGHGCHVTGEFASPTEVSGEAVVIDPKADRPVKARWTARWVRPLE